MTIYLIARMNVTDPNRFADYASKAPAIFAKHGGQYIGGGDAGTLEGPPEGRRIALIAFPDRAAAEAYYNDPDYAPVRAIRWDAADSELILVDGYDG